MPLRVAAIAFLNPAPLLYSFEHGPATAELATRYDVHYTTPAQCAAELHAGEADLGLLPIAELTSDLAVVPGCTIASLEEVRSILLLVRDPERRNPERRNPERRNPERRNPERRSAAEALRAIRHLATDTASRSSVAYVRVLLQKFYGCVPRLNQLAADPVGMLAEHDAALLIGDPALLAREHRAEIDSAYEGTLLWLDVAQMWHELTGLPWVAAVWAVRPEALPASGTSGQQLVADLTASRDAGLAHVEELVATWSERLPLSAETIRTYLTRNIHYRLDDRCLETIRVFRGYASEMDILPPLPELRLLER